MTIFGYARVSTTDQNLDRQLLRLKEVVKNDRFIITDKESGKDFDRKGYNSLIGTESNAPLLREGDMLVITSLDRLGRNYTEIRKQWEYITHTIKADIQVLDMPLLNTATTENSLDKQFIADLVLQILSYTAEKERANIRKRQQEGIESAKLQGKTLGRPKATYPPEWEQVYTKWQNNEITATAAMQLLSMTRTTFYKLVKLYKCS